MKRALSEAFARYGMSVSVLHGGETAETKAFLQLVKRENGEEPFSVTALGAVDEQCWRYLGLADVAVAMGDFVQCGERRYVVRAAGPFYVGEEIAYYRFAFWETSPLDTSLIRVSGGSGSAGTGTKTASSYYTVKRGDTLWGIANTYGVTLTALLNVNPQIKNPNRIAVGERVTLP